MLTITQRAERAAKRINKKIAQSYPLLADQLSVTVESQIARLEKQETDNISYFEQLQIGNQKAWERAIIRKEIAREFLTTELFADYERRYERIYGKRDYKDAGHCSADWWWRALRDNNVPWAWDHCPNATFHELETYQRMGQCPTCKRCLTPDATDKAIAFTQLASAVQIALPLI